MTAPPDDTTTDTQAVITALRAERDAALAREAALAKALAKRDTEYGERIEQQSATIDVLKVMSATPGDPQPVFDLIVRRATELCDGLAAALYQFDGSLVYFRAVYHAAPDPDRFAAVAAMFPMAPTREVIACRAILDRQIVHIRDTQAEPGLSQVVRQRLRRSHRSQVSIPLIRAGQAIGAISLGGKAPGGFTDSQIALLKTFAEQAVIAITCAETYRDLHEALEQQTATAEVLQVINAKPGDLALVFDAMLEKALALCESAFGTLNVFNGGIFNVVASRGLPAALANYFQKPITPVPGMTLHHVVLGEDIVHVADLMDDDAYRSRLPTRVALVDLGGARTQLIVSLRKDNRLIGVIMVYRREVRRFTDKQIALLENFAAQAVIAMENARLLGDLRQRTNELQESLEYQTASSDVLRAISRTSFDLQPVLDTVVETAARLCDADMAAIGRPVGDLWRLAANFGFPSEFEERQRARGAYPLDPDSPTVAARAVYEGRTVHIHDAAAVSGYPEIFIGPGKQRTSLGVPLLREGEAIGFIVLARQRVEPFTDRQIELVSTFADQAVIAIENTRLLTEQREALEQQTATAEVLQVINASPGNLAPVLDAMLEKATRLCDAAFGDLLIYNSEAFHRAAMQGVTPAMAEFLREPIHPESEPGSALYRIVHGENILHQADITDDEVYRSGLRSRRILADLMGARTRLMVALRKDDILLGVFNIFRQEVRPFSDKQIALLENFAAQAVIAMENARLINEQREALEQQTATAEVLQVINASPGNLAPVFEAILEKAHRICNFDMGSLATYDGTLFRAVATRGYGDQAEVMARTPYRPLTAQRALLRGDRLIHIPDTQAYPVDPDDAAIPAFVTASGFRACLMVPLRKDGTLLGFLTGYRKVAGPFSEKQIVLLENFASQAVIAMENARLINEQREALEQQIAVAEVLQVINASPGKLAPVFEAILEKAHSLCGAALGSLVTFDGELFCAVATYGFPEQHVNVVRRPFRPNSDHQKLIEGDRLIHLPDVRALEIASDDEVKQSTAERTDVRTLLAVPLRKDGTLLGFISACRLEVRPFSEREIALLENFAAQAVIAMENARLLDEIRQRQEELRITFENMGDGVALFDETQHLVAWNRKFQDILDVPDDIIARRQTFSEYVRYLAERGEYDPEADPDEHVRRLIEQAGQSRTYERTRPDGRVIEIRHNPVPGGGFVLIYADITERKRNEAEIRAARDAAEEASRTIEVAYRDLKTAQANLIQAENMASLGQLTAGIAHEIKNPLNFVNNFAELSVDLLGELKDAIAPADHALTERQRAEVEDVSAMLTSNLEKITEHGKRADGIVKAMLEHSRGSSGERRMVDMNALIDEALNLAYHGARAQDQSFNIILERDFGEGIAPIEVNPQDMTRVFLNIFSNGFYAATRWARDGGDAGFAPTLKVTTRDTGDAVEIRVRDNGIGIPADVRDKLFEPFFTTKPTGEGTGLGLSITYDIVTQQHGGTIAADSNVGEYSEFTIRLPRNP